VSPCPGFRVVCIPTGCLLCIIIITGKKFGYLAHSEFVYNIQRQLVQNVSASAGPYILAGFADTEEISQNWRKSYVIPRKRTVELRNTATVSSRSEYCFLLYCREYCCTCSGRACHVVSHSSRVAAHARANVRLLPSQSTDCTLPFSFSTY
jgi:hypothetical protein